MRKHLLAASVAIGITAIAAQPTFAVPVTINFDGLAPGTIVTNQFAGVTFSNTIAGNFGSPPGSSPPINIFSITGGASPTASEALVAQFFGSAASFVSIVGLDAGANGIRIDAYDSLVGGSQIATDQIVGPGAGVGNFETISVSAAGIRRVEFYQPFSVAGDGVLWDNFTFDAAEVPEPAGLAVLGLGLLGLGALRRRKKRAA